MKKLFVLLTLLSCLAIGCGEKKKTEPAPTPPATGTTEGADATTPAAPADQPAP